MTSMHSKRAFDGGPEVKNNRVLKIWGRAVGPSTSFLWKEDLTETLDKCLYSGNYVRMIATVCTT